MNTDIAYRTTRRQHNITLINLYRANSTDCFQMPVTTMDKTIEISTSFPGSFLFAKTRRKEPENEVVEILKTNVTIFIKN